MFSYAEMIHGTSSFDSMKISEDGPVIQLPLYRRRASKLHKKRRREAGEDPASNFRKKTSSVTCAYCKQVVHNSMTCKQKKEQSSQQGPSQQGTSQQGTSQQGTSTTKRKRQDGPSGS